MIPLCLVEDLGNDCDCLRETERGRNLRTGQNLRDISLSRLGRKGAGTRACGGPAREVGLATRKRWKRSFLRESDHECRCCKKFENRKSCVMSLDSVLQKDLTKSSPPTLANMTLFGDWVFADVLS